jgi:tRNA (guanine-N7-)-methyltransferase
VTADEPHRDLRSYGRRRGRKLSDRQEVLKRDLLPRVALDLTSPPPVWGRPGGEKARPPAVGSPPSPNPSPQGGGESQVFLEIGFGGGEHLLWQAEHNPQVTVIGCEPFEDGVVKVLTVLDQTKLSNIRLHMGDARDVLRWLPPASIDRSFILFPDPWPKRKHQKRRLVNEATLDMLARVMKSGAELRFGTDIGDYARSALLAFKAEPRFEWTAQAAADWRVRPDDWPQTRYEAKADREGRRRYYFRFVRVSSADRGPTPHNAAMIRSTSK